MGFHFTMQKVVNTKILKNNTFHQFWHSTTFGVAFHHPSGLTEVDEPVPHPEGEFDRWPWSPTPLDALLVVESEDEITIPQKRKKVSMRVFPWSNWYSLSD